MNSVVIAGALLAGAGLFIVFLALAMTGSRDRPNRLSISLAHYMDADELPSVPESGVDQRDSVWSYLSTQLQKFLIRRAGSSDEKSRWRKLGRGEQRLSDDLERADLKLRSTEWISILFGVGAAIFLFSWWRFGLVFAPILAVLVPTLGGRFLLGFRQRRRSKAFSLQLSEVIVRISNALKAGQSLGQALQSVRVGLNPPASTEFGRVSKETELGVPVGEALERLVERSRSEDLALMVSAVNINRIVGGNLAETLDNISDTIRQRVRVKGDIATITAQARVSGWIISLLPIGLSGVLLVIAPGYFHPLISDPIGWVLIGIGLFSMMMGMAIIQKIVDIEI
jgi:tight adherence protein B